MIIIVFLLAVIGDTTGIVGLSTGKGGAWAYVSLGIGIAFGILLLIELATRKPHD